jgi:CDP-diacylglycerol--serine O-phosphatidyltransferase
VRYRTFKDVHLSAKSFSVFLFLCVAGLAVGIATRASFVIPVYMAAYIAMGLAESLFFRPRPHAVAELPPAMRAELEADEALEPEEDDLEVEAKGRGDGYV